MSCLGHGVCYSSTTLTKTEPDLELEDRGQRHLKVSYLKHETEELRAELRLMNGQPAWVSVDRQGPS